MPIEYDAQVRKLSQQDRSHKPRHEANGGAKCGKSARCVRRGGGWKRGLVGMSRPGPARQSSTLLLEPVADFGGAVRVLPVKGATLENALDGLGHIQPAASKRRVERHDTVPAKPEHHLGVLVAGEIVPHK